MSKLQTRAFIYQLISFAILFILFRYLILRFTGLQELLGAFLAFVAGTILAPKFHAMKTREGEKLFMKWIFIKGIREIK